MATKHEEQLQSIFNNVNEWLKFAEAKNFGLLTFQLYHPVVAAVCYTVLKKKNMEGKQMAEET